MTSSVALRVEVDAEVAVGAELQTVAQVHLVTPVFLHGAPQAFIRLSPREEDRGGRPGGKRLAGGAG